MATHARNVAASAAPADALMDMAGLFVFECLAGSRSSGTRGWVMSLPVIPGLARKGTSAVDLAWGWRLADQMPSSDLTVLN